MLFKSIAIENRMVFYGTFIERIKHSFMCFNICKARSGEGYNTLLHEGLDKHLDKPRKKSYTVIVIYLYIKLLFRILEGKDEKKK